MVAQTIGRVLLGSAMVGAGVLHLTTQRQEFQAQVPDWFPLDEDLTVIGSGVVEISLGAAFARLYAGQRWIGAGIGALLMQRCLVEGASRGRRTIWLGVWERNVRAIGFYQRWHFSIVGSQPFLLGSDRQNDRVMARRVTTEG